MGNRRLGTKRLEAVIDNLLDHQTLNGINGSPFSLRNPDRVYLEEFFLQTPGINSDLANAAEATRVPRNRNFEVLGSNATSTEVTFSTITAGIQLATAGADDDSTIIAPHLDTNQTAWTGTKWGTENQIQWECIVHTTNDIALMGFWAGMKLTNTPVYATDDNQAYFLYDATDDSGALTTNANLHFVYSVGGVDHISDLGIAVAAATGYRLGITVDSDRKVSAWVNGVQYNLTSATTAGGVATGVGTAKSSALANDVDLIPYVGVVARAAAAKALILASEKMSRIIFE